VVESRIQILRLDNLFISRDVKWWSRTDLRQELLLPVFVKVVSLPTLFMLLKTFNSTLFMSRMCFSLISCSLWWRGCLLSSSSWTF
jgi:hypothetical protein